MIVSILWGTVFLILTFNAREVLNLLTLIQKLGLIPEQAIEDQAVTGSRMNVKESDNKIQSRHPLKASI